MRRPFSLRCSCFWCPRLAGRGDTIPGDPSGRVHVLLDTKILTSPVSPTRTCMELEAGVITSTVQAVGGANGQVGFYLAPPAPPTFR